MTMTLGSAVSARVKSLIDRHHRGNRLAAAQTLGVNPEQLAGLLSGDWMRFSLDALAALVCHYDVSVDWLLALPIGDAGTERLDHGRARTAEWSPRAPRHDPALRHETSARHEPARNV